MQSKHTNLTDLIVSASKKQMSLYENLDIGLLCTVIADRQTDEQ